MKNKKVVFYFFLFCFSFFIIQKVYPDTSERILFFDSNIKINEDSSMTVSEIIKVQSTGQNIRHGIYRDFPIKYKDEFGNNYQVGFEVLSVGRDGTHEPYHIKDLSNGVRVYIGDKDTLIPPGEYTYQITYKTNRQLGFFDNHDELYWNVTGNGWIFPIDKASAKVELPFDTSLQNLSFDGYTGPYGSRVKNFTAEKDLSGNVRFYTTKSLRPYEGLTIVVSWPKGFVSEPNAQMKFNYFLHDNLGGIFGAIGLIVIILYYLIVWVKVGKDPKKGTIIPLYNPPENLSPASVRYISKMGYDHKIFASAVINMAVKGFLTINEEKGKYKLIKKNKSEITALTSEEKKILTTLFSTANEMELKTANHEKIGSTIDNIKDILENKYQKIYFITNFLYFLFGGVLSIIFVVLAAILSKRDPVALFMCLWLTIWSFGVVFLLSQAITQWKYVISGKRIRWLSLGNAIFITVFSIPFIIGEIVGIFLFTHATSLAVMFVFICIIIANLLFYHLLKAPTLLGRNVLDKIEGFKMFLSVAEKERLNLLNPPDKTPELFEKYLPYALALDVENEWAEQFSDVLLKVDMTRGSYTPVWYSGHTWTNIGSSDFANSLGSAFSSAIASSSTAPGSSSGDGGGSGGGGGGGGGGGW